MTDGPKKEDMGRVLHFDRDASFYVKRGDAKRAQNDPISALSLYYEALERDPGDLSVRLAAAEILTDISRYNDSNKLLIPYMHKDADYCKEAYGIVGFNMLYLGEYEGARLCFDRFFELTDEVSDRTDSMLDALSFIDSVDEEPSPLSDAAEAEITDKKFEAISLFERGDYARSVQAHKRLLELCPDDPAILYRLALSCLCSREYEESDRYIDRLLEISPDHWSALGMKLMNARRLNNEMEVLRICKKLEQCDSDSPEDLLRVNGALLEAGRYSSANVVAVRLLKFLPFEQISNHRLAVGLMRLGQYKKAADIYDKLARIDKYDRVAKYYRAGCMEAASDPDCEFAKQELMLHYQLPVNVIMEDVRRLLDLNNNTHARSIISKWREDPDFRELVRWAVSLREYGITHAMIAMLQIADDERAQMLLREIIADVETRDSVLNEALAALKSMNAPEPFFAVSEGRLLEGRVNIVDLSDMHIPKAYRDIYPRLRETSGDTLGGEVLSIASSMTERFIMCSLKDMKPLSHEQSVALSAAVEMISCEKCGFIADDDLCEKYGITPRRLQNALDRMVNTFLTSAEDFGGDDTPPQDGGEEQ